MSALEERLREECAKYGLPTSGDSVEMFERLIAHIDGNNAQVVQALEWRLRRVTHS